MASVEDVRNLASKVIDPEIGMPLGNLRMIGSVEQNGQVFDVTVVPPTPAYPDQQRLVTLVTDAVSPSLGDGESVNVILKPTVRGKDAGGRIGLNVQT